VIPCLVPDLPQAAELLPWLARIDAKRWYTNHGPLVQEFEQRLTAFIDGCDDAECVTMSSGTSALELGLRGLGIGAGQRVLMPALAFPATALAVRRCGAELVFCDVCAHTWTLKPSIARDVLTRCGIDAIMPVATFGYPLPADEWDALAQETGLLVFADAAAALGVQRVGRHVHWAFSLHATKPLGVGEGGVFVSPDRSKTERVRRLANFGFDGGVVRSEHGTNAKLSEYAAAVGLAQLDRWPQLLQRRWCVFEDYRRGLRAIPQAAMQSPEKGPPATLSVRLPQPAAPVVAALAQSGIETRRWYLPPLTEHPAFRSVRRIGPDGSEHLPVTDDLANTLLGLPFHTRLSTEDVGQIVDALAGLLGSAGIGATLGSSAVTSP